ncbi:SH3 domain-containing protein [Kitasatospora purpeofusca]|uniref:SH3 domain-containing protein n=1 Tax=Kitasatospora purpeofusca TaxID=67352 RepID=UPI0004C06FF1|nr:SH3 domain-containing protein [Kitasatospora purpeofusca]
MPAHLGRVSWTALSLLILVLPAMAAGTDHPPPPERHAGPPPLNAPRGWVVTVNAANVRREHSVDAAVLGLAHCGERVEIVDTWISPLGTRWSRVVVVRSGLTGWVLWSLLGHPAPLGHPAAVCPTPPPGEER